MRLARVTRVFWQYGGLTHVLTLPRRPTPLSSLVGRGG